MKRIVRRSSVHYFWLTAMPITLNRLTVIHRWPLSPSSRRNGVVATNVRLGYIGRRRTSRIALVRQHSAGPYLDPLPSDVVVTTTIRLDAVRLSFDVEPQWYFSVMCNHRLTGSIEGRVECTMHSGVTGSASQNIAMPLYTQYSCGLG